MKTHDVPDKLASQLYDRNVASRAVGTLDYLHSNC